MKDKTENPVPLELALKTVDTIVASFKGNRQERHALELAFQKITQLAQANEKVIADLNKTILDQSAILDANAKELSELKKLLVK